VIEAMAEHYLRHNANVSRAVHTLGMEATDAYESARRRLAVFVGVRADDLVLTSGTTMAINLVAYSFASAAPETGEVILLSRMEHHANIVPWQLVAERTGASHSRRRTHAGRRARPRCAMAAMTPEVRLLGIAHVSNVLGTVNPVATICREGAPSRHHHRRGRLAGRAAPAGGHRGDRLRLLCVPPGTRCSARPAPARSGRGANTWRRCRPSSAAAR
jgi:cysteine sulfinate desulfinase/cysteine desulfurase-like protein